MNADRESTRRKPIRGVDQSEVERVWERMPIVLSIDDEPFVRLAPC